MFKHPFEYGQENEQEAKGQHRSPEKTVQINQHMIVITLIRKEKSIIYLMGIEWFFV